ncbi:ABC transporter substrate-binding protein [Paeniglutamicibacter cryotolerans]|uniref:Polar amino acid transport system substrate-binding protein n=1 Tax=Paeniglutamicibacter cryotolerans TaxID=670079 RepID=A0A839QQS2_9MICC|nr:ABC transporter substrate-binding protein [Paeniglutamicibacter cryotolerans]MBB2995602.1 polar amino acid transport system substrate-binding protein [Paeniglutamicibacter cryotolerans]
MRLIAKSLTVASIGLLAFSLSGCTTASLEGSESTPGSQGPAVSESAMTQMPVNEKIRALLPEKIRTAGVLKIASDPSYPPFEFFEGDQQIVGWDIDMGDAIGQVLGLETEHVAATFDTILPGLNSGKYDLGMSAFSMTPDRQKAMDMVQYLSSGTGLAVPAGNPKKLSTSAASLCGLPIGAQKGTSQSLEILPELSQECIAAGKPGIDAKLFPSTNDARLALISGRVDGVLAGAPSLAYQGKQSAGKFELAEGEALSNRPIGIALPKDSELTKAVGAAFDEVLSSDAYGQINKKWDMPSTSVMDQAKTTTK